MLRVDSDSLLEFVGTLVSKIKLKKSGEGVILGADELQPCGHGDATYSTVRLSTAADALLSSPATGTQVCTQTTVLTQVVLDIQVPYSRV
jgi:hypothetical protein